MAGIDLNKQSNGVHSSALKTYIILSQPYSWPTYRRITHKNPCLLLRKSVVLTMLREKNKQVTFSLSNPRKATLTLPLPKTECLTLQP